MTEKKFFIATSDTPEWKKWQIANNIAETLINYPTLREIGISIQLVSTKIGIEALKSEMEEILNSLLFPFGDQAITITVLDLGRELDYCNRTKNIYLCSIQNAH